MIFNLRLVNLELLYNSKGKKIILYADFNVLNFLYKKKISLPDAITLYPDSTAVYLLCRFYYGNKFKKIISTELQNEILKEAADRRLNVFFFGDSDEIISKIKKSLSSTEGKNICLAGSNNGYNFDSEEVIQKINESGVNILFLGLGASRQEEWILENYERINADIIIAVGGWFQYLAGAKKRAPKFIRSLHMEWIYKLVSEFPRVWKRYFLGVPAFFYRIVTKKIILKIDNMNL